MFGISKLVSAIRTLAENVLALAGTGSEINSGLRQRLALDAPEDAPRGEVLDNHPEGEPALPVPRRGGKRSLA